MSPRSLLFSSDQETSHVVSQVLRDLGLEVEHCSEIFSAVEKLTTRMFDLVLADLDEGAEAAFLLKTCQELNSTRSAFSVAIARAGVSSAPPGVGLVLNKPLIPEKIRWSLSHCEPLASKVNTKTSGKAEVVPVQPLKSLKKPALHVKKSVAPVPTPAPKPISAFQPHQDAAPDESNSEHGLVPLAESASAGFRGAAHTAALTAGARPPSLANGQDPLSVRALRPRQKSGLARIYRPVVMGAALLGLAYVGVQPARSAALVSTVAVIYTKAVENTQSWLQEKKAKQAMEEAQIQLPALQRSVRQRAVVIHLEPASVAPPASPSTEESQPAASSEPAIPSSLKSSFQTVADAPAPIAVEAKLAPSSVITGMQPVSVSEETFRSMVLDKVEPDYPKQALSSGLKGPVVFQAWIGKDGRVEGLKLVRGYMVLSKAASDAVKHWRFKPYMVNGQAVDAQTYITVDFKPPIS